MAVETQRMTLEEFERFLMLPANADRRFEYIGGEAVEVVSNTYASSVASRIMVELGIFLKGKDLGYLTGADGGYRVAGERYIPDVAFIAKTRQPPLDQAYCPLPPDLAIEVLSPSNDPDDMRVKVGNYLAAGTTVWVVNPDKKQVQVFVPGQPVRRLNVENTIEGDPALPGFRMAVQEMFPE